MMMGTVRKLREKGILGINARNAAYILPYNNRRFYPLVDDKLKTKELALQAGVAVPELYATVEIQRQVRDLKDTLEPYSEFVIKPAKGSGGEGIILIASKRNGRFRKTNGLLLEIDDLKHHISMIIGGVFSLGGHPDKAIIEYKISHDPVFEDVTYMGVPDIRIITFLGVPVMSMIRLPSRMSDGKANLHQGAVGAGICIATGTTCSAVWHENFITEHPDTGAELLGLEIPYWNELLKIAASSYDMTGLGYQGVDLVLDKSRGPLLLELNARPGLSIQIANNAGLSGRLKLVEQQEGVRKWSVEEKISFAREQFR